VDARPGGGDPADFRSVLAQLKTYPPDRLRDLRENNHEIFIMNADGSNPVNLTRTPDVTSCTQGVARRHEDRLRCRRG